MKKLFIVGLMVVSLVMSGTAIAKQEVPTNDDFCIGIGCEAQADMEIGTFAIGGGLSTDGVLTENGGAAGIGAAGGVAGAEASGHVESWEKPVYDWVFVGKTCWGWPKYERRLVGYETIFTGKVEGALSSTAGGFTKTEAFTFDRSSSNPHYQEVNGVGSFTENREVQAQQWVDLDVIGFGSAGAMFGGVAGQGSANGAFMTPEDDQNINGLAVAGAAQGSLLGYYGVAGAGLFGDVEIAAGGIMFGASEADAYNATYFFEGGKTEILTGYVYADTAVYNWNNIDRDALAIGYVNGGWVAGGAGYTASTMSNDSGFARATAVGTYSGSGQLGCNDFNASLEGYSKTQSTTLDGYNGTVMKSSAGMTVNIGSEQPK
jgi:hypothetical protein